MFENLAHRNVPKLPVSSSVSGHRLGSRRVEVSGNGNALDLQTADETFGIGIEVFRNTVVFLE